MSTLFVSDLHLCPERPAVTALFQRFLTDTASSASALYILGDLFEYWAGDDDLDDPHHAAVAAALAKTADTGTAIYLLHGNRDFLLGAGFARASRVNLLGDPTPIDLYRTPTLLSHGDTLCSDDRDYLALREKIRTPAWIAAFLAQPLAQRKAQIEQMRRHSEQEKQRKEYALMDANPEAVTTALRNHQCRRLIHGHTHRPARHFHDVDGQSCERWVLPAWEEDGGYLHCDAGGCNAVRIAG
ncbi:MAG: UDP-2,3-diacylglucosamine diphosphatase [Sulfuricella sp.]|nr:UDP-2,3-diacylglucosamine diphosphatase [Sulfuricella sp.]